MPIPGYFMGGACERCSAEFIESLRQAAKAREQAEYPVHEHDGHEDHPIIQAGGIPTCPYCGVVIAT